MTAIRAFDQSSGEEDFVLPLDDDQNEDEDQEYSDGDDDQEYSDADDDQEYSDADEDLEYSDIENLEEEVIEHDLMSERNREKRVVDGYSFTFDRNSADGLRSFWQCDHRNSDRCNARVHFKMGTKTIVHRLNHHTHGSDPALIEAQKVKRKIKCRAKETMEVG